MRCRWIFTYLVLSCSVWLYGRQPLPEDRGAAGLAQSLRRVQTVGRIAYFIAHPDDEESGMVTLLTRGKGYEVTFLMPSRGGASQDNVSSDFGDLLGTRRTLEMIKSSEYYGANLLVGRFEDFALSKSLERTLHHWSKEDMLRDMVRFIRQTRPHVVISEWVGTPHDYLGNHELTGIVARSAFDAAADPTKFPEQIAAGLTAWQPLKFYTHNLWDDKEEPWTIRVDSAVYDPLLGETYAQLGWKGLGQQISQGNGTAILSPEAPAHRISVDYCRLVASKVGMATRETDFFERIDTSLRKYPDIAHFVEMATKAFDPQHLENMVRPLALGLNAVRQLRAAGNKDIDLEIKERQFQTALNQALALEFEALVDPPTSVAEHVYPTPVETFTLATPGQTFRVTASYRVNSQYDVAVKNVELLAPQGWRIASIAPKRFEVTIPPDATPTSAYWTVMPNEPGRYAINRPELFGQPITPAPLVAKLTYTVNGVEGSITNDVETSSMASNRAQQRAALAVGPTISVRFVSDWRVFVKGQQNYPVICLIRSNFYGQPIKGTVRLELPAGWSSEPASGQFNLNQDQEETSVIFRVTMSPGSAESTYRIGAIASYAGQDYRTTFRPITEPGLRISYLSKPAIQMIRVVDVKVPKLRIGYVMGTGDEVAEALRQLGFSLDLLDEYALCCRDLSQYNTVILGIRAYLARKDVKTYNSRLLDYVRNGGVLLIQYNTEEFNSNYGPYPYSMTLAKDVTEENAPVEILDPSHSVFHYPNEITAQDFDGWVEKRGMRFMTSWDPAYKPLLSTHDTANTPSTASQPQHGGLLVATYGKGLYVYTAYAFYRQLPSGVAGGVRLFTNLISLGAHDAPWRNAVATENR